MCISDNNDNNNNYDNDNEIWETIEILINLFILSLVQGL